MSTKTKSIMVLMAAMLLLVAGCGKKTVLPTSVLETPEYHYKNGLKYLDNDKIDDAMKSFDRVIELSPKSPLGYIGRGLAFGRKGEFKPALENMLKAKGLDSGIEANIGMIRLASMERAKGWVVDAESEFNAAKKRDLNSAKLNYFMAMAYKVALDFDKAAPLFKTVLDMNKEFTSEANAEWAVIQKIQRASPGTEIGRKIALIDKIDRADIAALFDQELNLEKLFTRRGTRAYDTSFKAPTESSTAMQTETAVKLEAATDIAGHWLKPSIDVVLKLQIRGLEAGPNHAFDPDKLVTKGEFALMLEDIMAKVSGDEKLATKFLGATSPFPDIRNDQYFFNAVMTATSRGYLEADKATGEFKPGDPVSGTDALLVIRAFKDQLKF